MGNNSVLKLGGITLRGVAQEVALLFPVVLASAGTLAIDIEFTEE